jgi:hypothetical protein
MRKAQAGALELRLLVAQSAALLGEPALEKDVSSMAAKEAKGSQSTCHRQLLDLNLPADDPQKACEALAAQFGNLAKPLAAARTCTTDLHCWLAHLKDREPLVRARSAYELGWAGSVEAVPDLAQALGDEQMLVRAAATRALDWLASVKAAQPALKAVVPQLAAQLAREQGKPQYIKADEELRRLHLKLSRL